MPHDKPALCPFEKSQCGRTITCEGLTDGEQITRGFPTVSDQKNWRYDFCTYRTYRNCPIYCAIKEAKYSAVNFD